MLKTLVTWIVEAIIGFFFKEYKKSETAKKVEDQAASEDSAKADQAVADIQKPWAGKTVEEREKEAEDAFDKFRDTLS